MDWIEKPFIEYLNAVDRILERRFGVTGDDTDMALISSAQESLETPQECAEELARKYELQEIPRKEHYDGCEKTDIGLEYRNGDAGHTRTTRPPHPAPPP